MTGAERGIPRRAFVKSAVAIGGASALSACLNREANPDLPQGDSPATRPDRQHAWDAALPRDDPGNVVMAKHHVLLLLDFDGEGGGETPTDAERDQVETALGTLDRAYPWSNEGLLFTVGYSPRYFARFEEPLADAVDLPEPKALASFEEPELDRPDAVVHLASDYGSVVLAAEEALRGNREELNTVTVKESLADVFTVTERRTGFIGAGLPAEKQDVRGIPDDDPVPEDSPLFMGFKTGFEKNQATEDRVTIADGPFAGGTTQHLSRIRLNLNQWYSQDSQYQRVGKMFCPAHAENGTVVGVGENLGDDNGVDACADVEESARSYGVAGHAQKASRAREGDRPVILRRDFGSTDDDEAGLHFLSLQREISDFVATRAAMNGSDVSEGTAVGQTVNNGILQYLSVKRRGNYLLPPRRHRALPTPRPE